MAELDDAVNFWNSFAADPTGTYAEVTREMQAAGLIDPMSSLTPDEVTAWREEREAQMYDAALDDIIAANPGIDRDLFHTYVAAAQGDFSEAVQRYHAHVGDVLARHAPGQATPAPAAAEAFPTAPAAAYRGQSGLHQAIHDAVAMSRAKRGA